MIGWIHLSRKEAEVWPAKDEGSLGTQTFFYPLVAGPAFLTEIAASNFASRAIVQYAPGVTGWMALKNSEGQTAAPDGRPDEYLSRHSLNEGQILFTNTESAKSFCMVRVVMQSNTVQCVVTMFIETDLTNASPSAQP
ncbi:MAG: hypothetical protein AB1813_21565 [Verrucomicrobiota bacterium]